MESIKSQSHKATSSFKKQIEALKKKVVASYNAGLEYCYNCIITVLKKSNLELNMDNLIEAINEYMQEK